MDDSNDKTKLIDGYLNDQLPEEDAKNVEELLKKDPLFKAEYDLQSHLQRGIEAFGEKNLKDKLENIHQEVFSKQGNVVLSRIKWLSVAAAILISTVLGWWWYTSSSTSPTKLYEAYYNAYPISFSARNGETDQPLLEAGVFYQQGEFAKALPILEQIQRQLPNDGQVVLALAICHLENQQITAAQSVLLQVINNPELDTFHDLASWYLALSHLKTGQSEEAKQWLIPLVKDTAADKHQSASDLLKALN